MPGRLAAAALWAALVGGLAEPDLHRGEASFLSEQAETGAGLSTRIRHELREADRRVQSLLRGHPRELRKVDGLLRQASRMAKRARASQTLASQAREHFALLAEQEQELVDHRGNATAAHGLHTSVSAASASQALLSFAAGLAKVSTADREIFNEARLARHTVEVIVGGKAGAEAARLLGEVQRDQRTVVTSEAQEAHAAREEARHLSQQHATTAEGAAAKAATAHGTAAKSEHAALADYTSSLAHIAAADRQILSETKQGEEALESAIGNSSPEVEQALRAAEKAERVVVREESWQLAEARRKMARLEENPHSHRNTTPSVRNVHDSVPVASSRQALLGVASGLDKVSKADRKIFAEASLARHAVENLVGGESGVEAARLLGQVQHDQGALVTSEAREARVAREQAWHLRRQHATAAEAAGAKTATALGTAAKSEHAALKDYTSSLSHIAAADQRILSQTKEVEEAVENAIGSSDPRVEQALHAAERAERRVLHDESRQVREARHEMAHLEERPSESHVEEASSVAPRHQPVAALQAKLQQVRKALKLHMVFADREGRLAKAGQGLASRVESMGREAAAALKDGDSQDAKAYGMLWKHLLHARQTLSQLAAFHGRLAKEARQRTSRLESFARRLQAKVQQGDPKLLQQGGQAQALADQKVRALRRAAAEVRGGRRVLAETVLAEDAVEHGVRGSREAREVRHFVTRALRRAEHLEERDIALAARSLRRARHS
mmetsp:Transcript_107854/g.315279  ORF Transcript_107854/g.315279 Transcript_107854/m.315279 type:complete len:733 (+) Transcript_107854:76-2274(+)